MPIPPESPSRACLRLYYEREFDAGGDACGGSAPSRPVAPASDKLAGEARTWAETRTIQLGAHMARGMMAPVDAARPISNIVDTCLAALLAAAKPEFEKANGNIPNDRVALVALGAAGRRELATGAPFETPVRLRPRSRYPAAP